MKRLLLPVLLLVLLLCGLGTGIWLLASHERGHAAENASVADAAAKAAADQPVALEGPAENGAKPASERSAAAPAPPGPVVLHGALRSPAGIQDPGPLVVYALSASASYRELVRMLEQPSHDDDALHIVAQSEVGADGRFELSLPEGTARAHLALQGRFLYLERTRDLELARGVDPQLVPKAGACVRGSVALPEGTDLAALEALKVELNPVIRGGMAMRTDRPPRRSVPASGGHFEIRAVPIDIDYRTNIEADAFAFVEQAVERLRPGESRNLDLRLELGGTLRGRVQQPDGQAAAGADVEATREGDWFGVDDTTVRSAKTDGEGQFELKHVPAGKLKLRASLASVLPSERQELELAPGQVLEGLALLLREGKSIAGNVTYDDGKPAAGAEVKVAFDLSQMGGMGAFNAMEGAEGKAVADSEGHFVVGGLGKGPFTARASSLPAGMAKPAEGEKDDDVRLRARSDGITPGTADVQLVLKPGVVLRGRVVDSAQQPVGKFKIKVQHEGKGLMGALGQDSEERTIADAQGRFQVGNLSEGSWKVWVTAERFANTDALPVVLPLANDAPKAAEHAPDTDALSVAPPHAGDAPEFVITLFPCCSVSGRVVSAQGTPVGGARISVDVGGPAWQQALSGAPQEPQADSDADGTFRLDGLRPGHVSLVASATDHARSVPQSLELAAAAETKDVVLTLRDGGSISGEVYDEQGKPLVGMFVQATEMALFDVHFENTDGEGHFKLEHLQPGQYQVVSFPGKALGKSGSDAGAAFMSSMKMATAEVRDGADTHVILGAPPADPVQVVGRVTHAGQPFSSAMVTFIHEGKDVISKMRNVQIDAQGNFEVRLDEPGRYSVQVQRLTGGMGQQNMVEFQRDIPKEKRYEMLIEMPTGRISGKVKDPEGNPAKGERVSLHPRSALVGGSLWGGMYVEAQTDGDGLYDIQTLRPGEYVLCVGGMAMGGMLGGDATHGREMRTDLKVGEGDWLRDIDFRLRKPGKVDVTVVGEDGQPIAKAAIFARDANGFLLDRLSMVATDEGGIAHYAGLAPGEYSFSSRMDVRASAEGARVKLGEGESQAVKLVLQGASLLLVTVQDTEGKTVQAAVSVLDSQGHEAGGMYGLSELMEQFTKNGLDFTTARVGPLPPGKYTVTARTGDGKTGTKPVTLTGQPERKLTVRVE